MVEISWDGVEGADNEPSEPEGEFLNMVTSAISDVHNVNVEKTQLESMLKNGAMEELSQMVLVQCMLVSTDVWCCGVCV